MSINRVRVSKIIRSGLIKCTFVKVDDTHVRIIQHIVGLPVLKFSRLIDVQHTYVYRKCSNADEFLQYAYVYMDFNYE